MIWSIFFGGICFGACVVRMIWLAKRVRQILAERHPNVWQTKFAKAWFKDHAVMSFAYKRRDRELGDAELSARVDEIHVLRVIAFLAWLAGMASFLYHS